MSAPINSNSFRVVENVTFSKDFNQFILQFTDLYQKLATASNAKDIALYENSEVLNGQAFFGANPQTKIQIYRKCFAVTPPTYTFAHGIVPTRITRLYGAGLTTTGRHIPLPYVSATVVTNQIELYATATDIVITLGGTAPVLTSAYIIMEYQKN